MRLGVYTGTFDPPHNGHQGLVELALEQLELDRLFLVVNPAPPHKPWATPYRHRVEMARLLFRREKRVRVAPAFLQETVSQTGKAALVEALRLEYPSAHLFQIMGSDSFWRAPKTVLEGMERVTLAVSLRDSSEIRESEHVKVLSPVFGESSSSIKRELAAGRRPGGVCQAVWEYLYQRELYSSQPQLLGVGGGV